MQNRRKSMHYNSDKPIESEEQDLLGRANFSKQLGKAIYEYKGNDGLVIGLFGKWGTGKTSVINMIINEISNLEEANNCLVMKFDPWNYSDKDNLISLFFQTFKNRLNLKKYESLKEAIGQALKNYADALDGVPSFVEVSSGALGVLKILAKVKGAKWTKADSLEDTKRTINI